MTICRSFVLVLFIFTPISPGGGPAAAQETDSTNQRLLNLRTDADATVADLVSGVSECDVLFLGELHDSDAFHQLQLETIQALHAAGRDIVISMEMFERDVQGVVDDYLAGRIDEATFKANSRPWKNYDAHYRPIVEFAKQNNLCVIAGNTPRKLAGNVATGTANGTTDSAYVARRTTAEHDGYYQRFVEVMQGHVGAGGEEGMEKMYRAQCLKDDTMAESIVDFLDVHPHRRPLVVHLCGQFHSDYGYGTAMRVLTRRPLLKISVVTMRKVDNVSQLPDDVDRKLADFVLLVKKEGEQPGDEDKDEKKD